MWLSLLVLSIAWEFLRRRIATTMRGPIQSSIDKMALAGTPTYIRTMVDLLSRKAPIRSVVQVNSSSAPYANTSQYKRNPQDRHRRSATAPHNGYCNRKTKADSELCSSKWFSRTCRAYQMLIGLSTKLNRTRHLKSPVVRQCKANFVQIAKAWPFKRSKESKSTCSRGRLSQMLRR